MCYDLPRTEYAKTDKEGNVIKKNSYADTKKVIDLNRVLAAKEKAKRANEESVGEKISLTNLLEGK